MIGVCGRFFLICFCFFGVIVKIFVVNEGREEEGDVRERKGYEVVIWKCARVNGVGKCIRIISYRKGYSRLGIIYLK